MFTKHAKCKVCPYEMPGLDISPKDSSHPMSKFPGEKSKKKKKKKKKKKNTAKD